MSRFEFVTIIYSLVVAFGVSELLAALGRALRDHVATPVFVPQVLALLLLFFAFLQSLWGYWGFRNVDWSFWLFLAAFLPLLTLSIATSISIPAQRGDGSPTMEQHYFSSIRLVLPLLALWIVLGAVAELMLTPPIWHLGQAVRLIAILILIVLMKSRSESLHTIGLTLLGICQLVFVEAVTPALS